MSFPLFEDLAFNFMHGGSPGIDRALTESRLREFAGPVSESKYPSPIYPQFHVLTADKVTRNKTLYTYAAHKGKSGGEEPTGQYSFTRPYRIPLIEQHRSSDGCALPASPVYGRMIDARLVKNKESGSAYLAGLGEVSDPQAIHEILSGLWLTGSLGSTVHQAHCSICNGPLMTSVDMEDHPHRRGQFYRPAKTGEEADALGFTRCSPAEKSAQQCYTAVDIYRAIEYSKVVTPSDSASIVQTPDTSQDSANSTFPRQAGEPPSPAESLAPTSLWVPMAPSASRNVAEYGDRYLDVVSGREVESASLGLLSGIRLYEYVEQQESFGAGASWVPSASFMQPALEEGVFVERAAEDSSSSSVDSAPLDLPLVVLKTDKVVRAKTTYCEPDVKRFPATNEVEYRASFRLLEAMRGTDKAAIRIRLLREGRRHGWSLRTAKV